MAVAPLTDGGAHSRGDGADCGERVRRQVAVGIGEPLCERGHQVAGVGRDALGGLGEDLVHRLDRGGANFPAGIAHLLDEFFCDFTGDVGAGQAAVSRRDGRSLGRGVRPDLPCALHDGADVRVTRELSLQRLELGILEVG